MEEKKITQEDLFAAEAAFNLASLLGKSIQAAAFAIRHPDYDPEHIVWVDKPAPPPDDESDSDDGEESEEQDTESPDATVPGPGGDASMPGFPMVHSNEASIDVQIDQLTALYVPEIYECLKGSALYDMFHLASSLFTFNDDLLGEDTLSPANKKKTALAWIIVKRVFTIRHPDEALLIINITERPLLQARKFNFRPMDDTDREFITEVCSMIADSVADDSPIATSLATLSQIPPQNERHIALSSRAFREQREIAAVNCLKDLNVGNATIQARIGKEGDPPVVLTEFEMLVEQAIGDIIQYQTRLYGPKCLPIAISPEQLYRWVNFDGSSDTTVSPAEREMTIKAFDKLIQTPAELHILEQLEKHTRLKTKPGYKALLKNEGVIIGTLVTGVHVGAYRYNDKIINDALVVSFMPMFYYYSAFTGQLLSVDRKLITGENIKEGKATRSSYDVILRSHIFYRVKLIKQEKSNKNKKIMQQKKYHGTNAKPVSTFTKVILLSSLADECGFSLSSPKKLEVFRNKVLNYMTELVAQGEIIKAEPKYDSRRIVGVSVSV